MNHDQDIGFDPAGFETADAMRSESIESVVLGVLVLHDFRVTARPWSETGQAEIDDRYVLTSR